jgi:hypothetical protein
VPDDDQRIAHFAPAQIERYVAGFIAEVSSD